MESPASAFRILTRIELGEHAWDELALASDEAWLWHTFALQDDPMSPWANRRDLSFGVVDSGELVATMPVHRVVLRRRGIPWPVVWSEGAASRNDLSATKRDAVLRAAHGHLFATARRTRALEVRVALSPQAPALLPGRGPNENPLGALGGRPRAMWTWLVDLRGGIEQVWSGLEGRARTAIRKAERSGVSVRSADGQADVDTFQALYRETFRRTGGTPVPEAYLRGLWRSFVARDFAFALVAEHDGTPVAAQTFGKYKNAATYWTGAASAEGLGLEANSLLQWTAIQRLAADGKEWYDVGEAPKSGGPKDIAISKFKQSFGGTRQPIWNTWVAPSRSAEIVKRIEVTARRVLERKSAQ